MIYLLKSPHDKYTHVLHIADIHIRLNKRHGEYLAVFNELYKEVDATPETTVVAVLGDAVHSKSDLSPECVQMVTELLKNLADRRPTILIAGNHDATLSNKNRLDSLTPIVDALHHPNLFYLRATGLYGFGNILWNNMGVFDPPENYIRGEHIPSVYRNQYEYVVALFHGAVDKAVLETGYAVSNPAIMAPLFDNHDIALLGDVHKKQDIQQYEPDANRPCVHYPGSLIQQNHGEDLFGHGYSMWDLKSRAYQFHEIPNEYGFFTVDVDKGQVTSDLKTLPKKTYLRLKCRETVTSEVKAIVAKIKERTQVIEIAYVRVDKEETKGDVIQLCKDIVLKDLTNIEYQNRLIKEFLQQKLQMVDTQKIDDILAINRATNALIKRDDFARNLKWTPIRFEWDNMFTYGEGNVIDFTQMDGVYGIFGPNRAGKSSILSAFIFCLFDKFDRGFKGNHVLNVQKSSFRCKLQFEIAGITYFIERKGSMTRAGNVKVDVRFSKVINGVEEDLHGTDRRDTNDIIRDYIGTYEDFILTAVSFQTAKNSTSFIDMGNSERKDLLVQFIGLNVFDRLHDAASERNKELNTILKLHKDKNYPHERQQNVSALAHANTLIDQANTEGEGLKKQIAAVNEEIIKETANLIKIDDDVPTNIQNLNYKKDVHEKSAAEKKAALDNSRTKLAEKEAAIAKLDAEIQKIESSNFVESYKAYKAIAEKRTELKQKIDLKKIEIKGKIEKRERLSKHEYDPNCKYCVNNAFVKDAQKAIKELVDDKKTADDMLTSLEELNTKSLTYQWVEEAYQTYTSLLNERSKVKDEAAALSRNTIVFTNELEKIETTLKGFVHQIELYHRNEVAVENNTKVQSNISSFKSTLTKLDIELQKQGRLLMDLSGKRELFKANIDRLEKTIVELAALESESNCYHSYMQSVGRDGIPYQVICNTVPEIEKEVNSILSQIVDYTIQFETDGKNVVPYVVYEHGRWPIELTSGFERFVASIAIRVALTNVSNLPKTSGLFIDEGWGCLDADNMASMHSLLSLLKNFFDFIIIISHIDAMKDAAEHQIEIHRENGLSKVVFE